MCVKEAMSFWREAWVDLAEGEEVGEEEEGGGRPARKALKSSFCCWRERSWKSCLTSVFGCMFVCVYVSTCLDREDHIPPLLLPELVLTILMLPHNICKGMKEVQHLPCLGLFLVSHPLSRAACVCVCVC
jgi:hypothetical protein